MLKGKVKQEEKIYFFLQCCQKSNFNPNEVPSSKSLNKKNEREK